MDQKLGLTFFYTLLTSGLAYFYTYYLISGENYQNTYGGSSFAIGIAVYLIIRSIYLSDSDLNIILARTYRLLIILGPLSILSVILITYFYGMENAPVYKSFYSLEDLQWSSILIIVLWPLLNLFVLCENIVITFWMAVFYVGLPLLIIADIIVLTIIIKLYKKLIQLKRESIIIFSLSKASLQAITPLILFISIHLFYIQ